jgi:ribosomal protein L7/L12
MGQLVNQAKAEVEARVKAEVEARFKAEEEARLKAEADADLKKAIAYFGLGNIDPTNTIFGDMTVAQKNSFDIVLKKAGALKGEVTKLIKAFAGLGLKEAKDLVDDTPSVIKRGVAKAEAEAFKKQLEEVGAEVELK